MEAGHDIIAGKPFYIDHLAHRAGPYRRYYWKDIGRLKSARIGASIAYALALIPCVAVTMQYKDAPDFPGVLPFLGTIAITVAYGFVMYRWSDIISEWHSRLKQSKAAEIRHAKLISRNFSDFEKEELGEFFVKDSRGNRIYWDNIANLKGDSPWDSFSLYVYKEWERDFAHHIADKRKAAERTVPIAPAATQQPHGHGFDEGSI